MPLEAPNLDDRTYEQIREDLLRLIPRYAKEWTFHGPSDPGMTLVELFSWLQEMTQYRLNQLPDRNYVKFLDLIGIERAPAIPATAELTFTLAREDIEAVVVPLRTQVAATGADGDPVVFETDESLIALGAPLVSAQAFDGFGYSNQTTRNDSSEQRFNPFGPHAREGSALVLGFGSAVPFTAQQINLAFMVATSAGETPAPCPGGAALAPPPAELVWEYWDGSYWREMQTQKDETRALTRSGHVYLTGPGTNAQAGILGSYTDESAPLYFIRCRVDRQDYERPPVLDRVLTNTVRATQAVTVEDDVLGGSSGEPGQEFTLRNAPVIEPATPTQEMRSDGTEVEIRGLRLEINEGDSDDDWEVWEEVDDFYASKPHDRHYTFDRASGVCRFGDGENGRIPIANIANRFSNVVARLYRHGGGARGNIAAESITELQSFVEGVDGVTNYLPSEGGSDEETLEEAKLRAPRELKTRNRAVTEEDFETIAIATPGVRIRRAKALPLHHPRYRDTAIAGVVTVIVVPDSADDAPIPSESTLQAVCAHLDGHRLLTSELYVVPPCYREISVEATLVVLPGDDLAEVKAAAEERLSKFFHPLDGGAEGEGWEFGRDVYFSQVYREILEVKGVDRIKSETFFLWLDGEKYPGCTDAPLEPDALLFSKEHKIRVEYDYESAP